MPTFCHHCGTAIADGEERCARCGARLLSPPPSNGKPETSALTPPKPAWLQDPPEELVQQAWQLMKEGAYDDAIRLCHRAIVLNPQMASAHALLGELYERIGEPNRALGAYEQALAIDSHYEPARLGRARLLQSLKSPLSSTPPTPTTPSGSPLWIGHPLPLLAATALVVTMLFAVRSLVPPPLPSAPSNVPNAPILLTPSPTTPMPRPSASPSVQEAMRKGLEALNRHNYEGAIYWFTEAANQAPNNNEVRSWLLLAQAMKAERQGRFNSPSVTYPPSSLAHPMPAPSTSVPPTVAQPYPAPQQGMTARLPEWTWQQRRALPSPPLPPTPLHPQPSSEATPAPSLPSSPPATLHPDTSLPVNATAPTPTAPSPSAEELEQRAGMQALQGNLTAAADFYRMALARLTDPNREGYLRQQLALTLQQLGRYEEAAAEYERAIVAYQQQIQRGIQVDVAQRGIEACQRGLEICRQSP